MRTLDRAPGVASVMVTWLRRLLPLAFLLLIGLFAGRELAQVDVHQVRASVKAVPILTLVGIQIAALLGVLAMSLYDILLSRWLDVSVARKKLLRYSWVANTFNNFVGLFGLAGSGIRYLLLTRDGARPRAAAAMSASLLLSVPVGLGVLALPTWFVCQPLLLKLPLPTWMGYLALALFSLYVPTYLLLTGAGFLHRRYLHSVPTLRLTQRLLLVVISLFDWLLAALVAWLCLTAAGASVPAPLFLGAFVLAATLGIFTG